MLNKIHFIVQARSGSSRLPQKILLPFFEGKSLLELLIDKLSTIENSEIIIATSQSPANDEIEMITRSKGVSCYRGAENDVLDRFIRAAEAYDASRIIRVCSDNPFLELDSIRKLIAFNEENTFDYAAFRIADKPSIQTHYGFWTEYVTLDALKRVAAATSETLYHEHVTNYIYTHAHEFRIGWLAGPEALETHENIRLTIDTDEDFQAAQQIYRDLSTHNQYATIADIVDYLDGHPQYYESMKNQIIKNSK